MPEHALESPEEAHLRVQGYGELKVELVSAYLTDMKYAYDSISIFLSDVDHLYRPYWELPFFLDPLYVFRTSVWRAPPSGIRSSLVPPEQQLVLESTNLNSPGLWTFLGNLNVLEVIRKYLADRNERRKDLKFRDEAETERLRLQNELLKNKVYRERLDILRINGVPTRDRNRLAYELVGGPLFSLGRHQDKRVIASAELTMLADDSGHHHLP